MLCLVSYHNVAAVQCRWVALLRLENLSLDFRIAAASKTILSTCRRRSVFWPGCRYSETTPILQPLSPGLG